MMEIILAALWIACAAGLVRSIYKTVLLYREIYGGKRK